jgi:hypothetical protein
MFGRLIVELNCIYFRFYKLNKIKHRFKHYQINSRLVNRVNLNFETVSQINNY